jgi:hypothetical protein
VVLEDTSPAKSPHMHHEGCKRSMETIFSHAVTWACSCPDSSPFIRPRFQSAVTAPCSTLGPALPSTDSAEPRLPLSPSVLWRSQSGPGQWDHKRRLQDRRARCRHVQFPSRPGPSLSRVRGWGANCATVGLTLFTLESLAMPERASGDGGRGTGHGAWSGIPCLRR